MKTFSKLLLSGIAELLILVSLGVGVRAQNTPTPAKALLILEKDSTQLDIIDPASLKIVGHIPVGEDPHEVIASADGKTAYVSNYMGRGGAHHQLTVIDLVAQKQLAPIDLGALEAPHGLDFAGGKLYFTAEAAKAIGRYDPATGKIDWVMGTGQDRTHMVWVAKSLDKIVTSNVSSGTVSIIEEVTQQGGPGGPPAPGRGAGPGPQGGQGGPGRQAGPSPGFSGNQKAWEVTDVTAGAGSEGFDVSPDGKQIWTANAQDNTATIIDLVAKKDLAVIPISVRGANRLKFTLDGKYVLISGLGAGGPGRSQAAGSPPPDLVVIDVASRKEIKKLSLGGGSAGILMDPDGTRAFVASSGGNKVLIVDLKSFSVTGEISPLGQPDGMAWAIR
jgi:DNA-binding beta-propeller fold protein YncE